MCKKKIENLNKPIDYPTKEMLQKSQCMDEKQF